MVRLFPDWANAADTIKNDADRHNRVKTSDISLEQEKTTKESAKKHIMKSAYIAVFLSVSFSTVVSIPID